MNEGQKYFGENDIKPDFLTAKNLEENPSLNVSDEPSFYAAKASSKKKIKFNQKLKHGRWFKGGAIISVVAIVAILILILFGSNSFLGPHLEALFTEATSTDYAAYTMRTNEITLEILSGKLEMPQAFKTRLENNGIKVIDNTTLEFNSQTVTADNFMSLYNGNVDFREAFQNSYYGRVALFFDSAAEKFYDKLGLSKDVFHDYTTTGNAATDDASYNSKMTTYFDVDAGATINTAEKVTTEDEEGNTVTEIVPTGESISTSSSISSDSKEARATEYLDAIGDKVTAKTEGDAVRQIGDLVATAISANNNYTAIHEFMTKMENISKSKYGEGENSAINSVLNWFTKTDTATVYDAKTGEKITVTGAPLEAEGMRVILGGLTANKSNSQKYSLERSFDSTTTSLLNFGLTSSNSKTTEPSISLSAHGTPGGSFIKATIGSLLDFLEDGVKITASSFLGLLVPTIADVFFSNPFNNAVGIAGGESFAMGAANINQLSAQQNSGASAASKEQVLAYNHQNNLILAQSAEIDRKNHSPFDAENPNTFLGSIASSLLPLATTTSTLSTPFTTLAKTAQTAIASTSPAYADGENTTFLTNFGDCEKLAKIGASGNIYCKSNSTHDLSIISLADDDAKYRAVLSESLEYDENGHESIIKNSPLADYINFWTERYSAPGVKDANIAYECMHRHGYIPLLSNLADMLIETSDYCESVADGSRYVNSPDNPAWENEKYHQLYVLSNRVKTNLGFYEDGEDPIAVYEAEYETTHPLDNSRSGYLARISGLSKTEAENVLALSDYYQALKNYDPAYAYNFSPKSTQNSFMATSIIDPQASNLSSISSSVDLSPTDSSVAAIFTNFLAPITTRKEQEFSA